MLAGFAITAVAVAPLVPDAASLPQRLISEAVVPDGMDEQLTALAQQELSLTRSDVTRATDTVEGLFARLGLRDASAAAFIRSDATARQLLTGRGGKMVQARSDGDGRLIELTVRYPSERVELAATHFNRMTIGLIDGRWLAQLRTAAYSTQMRLASGTIRNTLFAATDEAGLPDTVSAQIAEIFAADIDFHRELRKGDTFSVIYEALTADGEPVTWNESAGRVQAAEFTSGGKAYHAVWFTPVDGRGAYFDTSGRSKRRSFLASPMEFSRVTSGFAMRMHPLLGEWRQHLGVDYAAPTGTTVRAVADGTVEFAGQQGGYGNVVQLRHSADRSTLYAHLSRIDVRAGQRVDQGLRIGAVGSTGWATGPHLHFEFRVAGQHQDPIGLAKAADAAPLDTASRWRFTELVRVVQARLDVAETLVGQRGQVE